MKWRISLNFLPHLALFIYISACLYTYFYIPDVIKLPETSNLKTTRPVLGSICATAASFFVGLSFVLQKKGQQATQKTEHNSDTEELIESNKSKSICYQSVWWAGLLSLGAGEVIQIGAYKFAPTTLVAPLGGMRVMVSTFLSKRYLKENLSKKSVQGILISLLGALLIVIHAPRQETTGTVTSILSNTSIYFQVYFTSLVIFTTVTAYKLQVEDRKTSSDTEIQKNIALFATLQTCTLGTIGVMCTKLMTMISVDSFDILYLVVLAGIIVTAPTQVYYVNVALKYEKASKVTPIKYAGTNVLIVIGSILLFNEWSTLTNLAIIGMLTGLITAIHGITLVVKE